MKSTAIGILAILLVSAFCVLLLLTVDYHGARGGTDNPYLAAGASETGAVNLVSGIYLNYRLYDSLFELLIFSMAVLGVRFYLNAEKSTKPNVARVAESPVVRIAADLLFGPIMLIGVYLIVFGHLSPGGGFSGGAVGGTGLLLCAAALGAEVVARRFHEQIIEQIEWGILLLIILFAVAPIFFDRLPLTDLLPSGRVGKLLSGGTIPIYNGLIGIKVFIGTWVVIYSFIRHRGEI
ncbi:MAG TPA: cation:proton antiporter [Candidatus Acetothermia bacterium]|nr:cation:proton antiporter [Candidatus Acetothermia bacterium]